LEYINSVHGYVYEFKTSFFILNGLFCGFVRSTCTVACFDFGI